MAFATALSIYSMEKYIEMLKLLIAQHVFVTTNQEKIDLLKARTDTRQKLIEIRAAVAAELERLC